MTGGTTQESRTAVRRTTTLLAHTTTEDSDPEFCVCRLYIYYKAKKASQTLKTQTLESNKVTGGTTQESRSAVRRTTWLSWTWASFHNLWQHFHPVMWGIWQSRKTPGETRGRKRAMRTIDVLGGCLMYLHVFIKYAGLCALLSQTPARLSD